MGFWHILAVMCVGLSCTGIASYLCLCVSVLQDNHKERADSPERINKLPLGMALFGKLMRTWSV